MGCNVRAGALEVPRGSSGEDSCASTAGGVGWIPGWGIKIPHAAWRGIKKKKSSRF